MISAYEIGVKIAAQNNASGIINVIARDILGLKTNVIQANNAMKGLKVAAAGAGMAMAGLALLGTMKAPLEEAKLYQLELTKLKNLGVGDHVLGEADKLARGMNIAGSSARDNLRYIREATSVFRDAGLPQGEVLNGAKLAAPMLAKIAMVEKTLDPETAGRYHTQSLSMLRFIESAGGLQSAQKFNALAEGGFKAIQSSGGNVSWEQYRQFEARSLSASKNLDPEVLFGKLEPIIGLLKGSTAGTGWRMAYNRLNGVNALGMGPVANELIQAGIWDASKVNLTSEGTLRKFKNGVNPLIHADEWAKDPVGAYEKYLLPLYDKKGMTAVQRARENSLIFGSTGGNFYNAIDGNLATIHKSVLAMAKHLGVNGSFENAKKTLAGKENELQANWQTLMLQLGDSILPLAIRGMEVLNPMIKGISDWAGKHPGAIRAMMVALVGIGVAFTAIGTVLTVVGVGMAAAVVGISGPILAIGAGIVAGAAFIGAGAALLITHWSDVQRAASNLWSGLGSIVGGIVDWIKNLPGSILNWLRGGPPTPSSTSSGPVRHDDLHAAIRSSFDRPIVIHNITQLDGKTIAQHTERHLGNKLNSAPTGPSSGTPGSFVPFYGLGQ